MSDPSIAENERAPHDGEYVGAIEVVVLRCFPSVPSNPSPHSTEALINKKTAISSDSSSDSDDWPKSMDGTRDRKSMSNVEPKAKHRTRLFGLDGAWDDPISPLSPIEGEEKAQGNPWDSWGEAPATTEHPADQSWDNPMPSSLPPRSPKRPAEGSRHGWGEVPGTSEKPRNDTWGHWNEQTPARNEKNLGTVEMTSADTGVYHPPSATSSNKGPSRADSVAGSVSRSAAGSMTGSQTGSQGSKSCENGREPSLRNQGPISASRAGSVVESRPVSQSGNSWGKWNGPSSSKKKPMDRSKAGSFAGSSTESHWGPRSKNAWGSWNQPLSKYEEPQKETIGTTSRKVETHTSVPNAGHHSSSEGGRAREPPSSSGQQTHCTLELRGGGSSSYSARSRRGSIAGSPIFNVGFYNGVGTPPALDQGPPPPRNWQAEEATKKKSNKQGYKPVEQPVDDAWGDLPAFDATAAVDAEPQDKVDNWNAGGSNMPGAWDKPSSQTKDENSWGATNTSPQQDDGDAWGAPSNNNQNDDFSKDKDWGAVSGGAKDNGTWPGAGQPSDWDDPAKENDKDSNSDNGSDNIGKDWAGAADNNHSSGDGNGKNGSNIQQDNDWNAGSGEDNGTQQNSGWANNDVEDAKITVGKSVSLKGSKKGSKAGSVDKGSKTGGNAGSDKATSVKSKGKSPSLKGSNNAAGSKKGSAPGGWSPTPKSKKGASPKTVKPVITNDQFRPSFPMSAVPKAKAYWSTWKNPEGEDGREEDVEVEPPIAAEEPLCKYSRNGVEICFARHFVATICHQNLLAHHLS